MQYFVGCWRSLFLGCRGARVVGVACSGCLGAGGRRVAVAGWLTATLEPMLPDSNKKHTQKKQTGKMNQQQKDQWRYIGSVLLLFRSSTLVTSSAKSTEPPLVVLIKFCCNGECHIIALIAVQASAVRPFSKIRGTGNAQTRCLYSPMEATKEQPVSIYCLEKTKDVHCLRGSHP